MIWRVRTEVALGQRGDGYAWGEQLVAVLPGSADPHGEQQEDNQPAYLCCHGGLLAQISGTNGCEGKHEVGLAACQAGPKAQDYPLRIGEVPLPQI